MATFFKFQLAAGEEFDDAFDWYANRSHGAAVGFAATDGIGISRTGTLSDVVGSEVVLCQMANGVDEHLFPLNRKDGPMRGLAADAKNELANWERKKVGFADEGVPLWMGYQRVDCRREFIEPAQGLIDVSMLGPPEGISIEI